MAKLNRLVFYEKDNWVSYDDSDPQSDYSNSYSIGLAQAVSWIKKDGAPSITVSVVNDDPEIPALQRLRRIAKECGYKVEDKCCDAEYSDGKRYRRLEWVLRKQATLLRGIWQP